MFLLFRNIRTNKHNQKHNTDDEHKTVCSIQTRKALRKNLAPSTFFLLSFNEIPFSTLFELIDHSATPESTR